MSKKEEVRQTN